MSENSPQSSPDHTSVSPARITPELVAQITNLVYAMLISDLRLERERCGRRWRSNHYQAGGR